MFYKQGLRPISGFLLATSLLSTYVPHADAAILLSGTRVIVNEKDREASIPVKNESNAPFVVQAWIDAGDGNNKTPFLVTPPLSRLDPGAENILRIVRVSAGLPADRESVFWLNVKEIPEKAAEENVLQVAVRTRIKLFYRPAALKGGNASDARQQLKWAVVAGENGRGAALKIVNPSRYHVTFISFKVNDRQDINTDMLAPYGEAVYPLSSLSAPQSVTVTYTTINDYGSETPAESVAVPATSVPVAVKAEPVPVPTSKR